MKPISFFFSIIPLMLFASGAWAQVVAPYPYHQSPSYDLEKLFNLQEKFLLKRLKASPDSGLDLAALASTYVALSNLTGDLQKMDLAEITAKESLKKLPFYNTTPKLIFAQVAEARHKFAEAITIASELLKEKPGDLSSLSVLVSSNLGFGKIEEAGKYADELVKLSPGPDSFIFRALVNLARGMDEEGLADFNRALAKEGPGNKNQSTWLRTLMGRHYYRSGDMVAAENYTDSALLIDSDYHLALAQKADILSIRGENTLAHQYYKKATDQRLEPPYFLAWARFKEKLNDKRGARLLRAKVESLVRIEMDTTPYGHHNELSRVLIDGHKAQDREEAVLEAEKDVEQRDTSESYYQLALALVNAEKLPEAKTAIERALIRGENNCEYVSLSKKIDSIMTEMAPGQLFEECPQFYMR